MTVLEPFVAGRLRLANRLALAATVTNLGRNHEIPARQVAYYAERARDGVGLVITEGLAVHPSSIPNETVPLAFERELVPQFARLATAVHAHGRAIVGQLWHAGRQALWNPMQLPWSASSERDPYSGSTPHAMTDAEVVELVDAFAESAHNLQAAGFDGVELHGAHGYLLTQFMSPWSNRRDDRWGGSVENRARLVAEITRAIRARCGDGFVVGLKLSVDEGVPGGLDLEASQALVAHLADAARLDYVVSQGNFSPSLEWHVPDLDLPAGALPRALPRHPRRRRRRASGVMGPARSSRLRSPRSSSRTASATPAAFARAAFATRACREGAARGGGAPCTYCNACWHQIHTRAVQCFYAPEAPGARPTTPACVSRISSRGGPARGARGRRRARRARGRLHGRAARAPRRRPRGRRRDRRPVSGRGSDPGPGRHGRRRRGLASRAGGRRRAADRLGARRRRDRRPSAADAVVVQATGLSAVADLSRASTSSSRSRTPSATPARSGRPSSSSTRSTTSRSTRPASCSRPAASRCCS
ncbi:MAG: hypothetical protein R3C15_04645 [Thermoleophilia bacterium]